jgi:Zn-finger nucleic acid-binding protein
MQIESLNCPNCGAGVMSDAVRCIFCHTRLKTMACPECLGLMFQGSKHCPKCGAEAVAAQAVSEEKLGDCPRCKVRLSALQITDINLRECERCDGLWSDAVTFENICADRESHAAVMQWSQAKHADTQQKIPIQYVPCPDCKQLMNRNNFAKSSGVIIDICKQHGVWFDADELPRVIEFIHAGGLDHARQKEKMQLDEDRRDLQQKQYMASLDAISHGSVLPHDWNSQAVRSIRDFVAMLFD